MIIVIITCFDKFGFYCNFFIDPPNIFAFLQSSTSALMKDCSPIVPSHFLFSFAFCHHWSLHLVVTISLRMPFADIDSDQALMVAAFSCLMKCGQKIAFVAHTTLYSRLRLSLYLLVLQSPPEKALYLFHCCFKF